MSTQTTGNYTRHYIAFTGKRIHGVGKTKDGAIRSARRKGVKGDLATAFAAKALVERVAQRGTARFQIAVNGRANLA